ncbi:MAG: hypothetical protein Q9169_003916 [Polycauliona sp. 2 TL-2023]
MPILEPLFYFREYHGISFRKRPKTILEYNMLKRAVPGPSKSWYPQITRIASPYPFIVPRPLFNVHTWTPLEALPPEVFGLILDHLAFFDKKALSSTSWRAYDLAGPLKPPDRFAWRLHLCSAFNRCTDDFFDTTIFNPDDITRELTRINRQFKDTPRKGHYAIDVTKTRFKDLTCLYFPNGFLIRYGSRKLVCRTLGHFVAIQFRAYVARLLWETKVGHDSAFQRRYIDPRVDFTEEHKASLDKEAHSWAIVQDLWVQSFSALKSDVKTDGLTLPDSAVEATEALVRKMGVQELRSQVRSDDRRWKPAENRCTEIPSPTDLALPMLFPGCDVYVASESEVLDEEDEDSIDGDGASPTLPYETGEHVPR